MLLDVLSDFTQFGVAGLMGALWVWERTLSRKREAQLNASHAQIVQQQQELRVLVRLVRRNTQAIERFDQTQKQLRELLEKINDEIPRHKAA
ncbi:MAG: hypothetical protein ACODAQ_04350 [Phycisphaeraceae bacterium]